tara:strand:+ start:80 stop:706 length:627 start_codon:yes stop_codon:yes gene_type:complete
MSLFFSFEGIDGSGKSTQVKMLLDYLTRNNNKPTIVREPGGTEISEEIRKILLKNRDDTLSPRTEALLMTASRNQLINQIIIPRLEKGEIIIADRFSDSTLAYQGGGRSLDINWLIKLNKFATHNVYPDITFYIDIPPEEWQKRNSSKQNDRFENAGYHLQKKVRDEYLKIVDLFPERIIKINGLKSPLEIHEFIVGIVSKKIKESSI